MLSIYNYMTSGVLLTGIVALLFSSGGVNSLAAQVFISRRPAARWIIMLAPLGDRLCDELRRQPLRTTTLQVAVLGASRSLMGMSLSTIFLVYTGTSIAATFFATAGAFAGLSLFGYTTKKDLSGDGHVPDHGRGRPDHRHACQHVPAVARSISAISFLGVLIFAGLTA